MWSDDRLLKLFNIRLPIVQAPMAGAADSRLAVAVANAGGLGSIACAMLSLEQIRKEVSYFRSQCPGLPLNLNFFCHKNVEVTAEQNAKWMSVLKPYYEDLKVPADQNTTPVQRMPFTEEMCSLMEELKPQIISFHFGLPEKNLLDKIKLSGMKIISSATTVDEALYLEKNGCHAIIAQGFEAGGHRATFLTNEMATQVGTMSLVPLIVDAVKIPVIASGGISDPRTMAAAFILGASAVQIGTAYLFTPEATINPVHQKVLLSPEANYTALTNIFSGKPARGIVNKLMRDLNFISSEAPPFPAAGTLIAPLKAAADKTNVQNYMSLWSGQSAPLVKKIIPAQELTEQLATATKKILHAP